MRVPVSWLREYVDFDWPLEELARRLVFTSCEVDRIIRRGVPDDGGNLAHFVVGKVLEAGKHPNADKLQLTKVDVGDGEPRSIVCGAWNFGVGATVAVVAARRRHAGRRVHDRAAEAPRRGLRRDDPQRARARARLSDHGGIMVLPDALEPGTPLSDVLPLGDDVLEIETLYNRPDLTSIYGIAREVAVLTGVGAAAAAWHRSGARGRRAGRHPRRGSRPLPALRRAPVPRRAARRVARVAEGAADRRRHAPDLERRRRHELRDARARQPAARVRLRHARRAAASSSVARGPGEAARDARRHRARARPRRSRDRRRRAADRDRRRHGRRATPRSAMATTSVLLEAANFEPLTVLRSGERHHMRTESQTRWEKGVDPEARGPRGDATRRSSSSSSPASRWTGEAEVRGEIAAPAVLAFRPSHTRRGARVGGARGRAARSSGAARVRRHAGLARADAVVARA